MLPSKHGFLPAVVPNFDLGPGFARYVLIADIMYLHYDGSPFEFRTWLQQQLEEVDIQAVARDMETWDAFQKRCGLVPLSFLAHAYRWGTSNPPPEIYAEKEVELPMKLEAPLEVLCDELRIPVGGSITQLFLYNWTLPGHQGGQEYSDADLSVRTMRPRFHFTKDAELQRAETAVFHSVILTESASTQLCRQAIRLFHAVNAGTAGRVAAADSLERISDALKQLLSIFHTIFRQEHISVSAWTNHLQPFYGAITPEGKGVGGLQLPWVHCTDALFAISLDDTIGKLAMENRAYMLPEERSFVSYLETHNQPLLMYLAKTGAESDVAKVFRACINTLVQWRATHRSRAVPYLQPPDNLVRQSTGKLVTIVLRRQRPGQLIPGTTETSGHGIAF
ncbi:hypothetical protein WJX72_008212 [[Myrmecia] bisecta]|uniref:Indoleamine 2,3-dioxygenase n=1 Tax=[Myrmecia] bisecta TaxID=41462 RepID=A0AAW1Q1B2_9CHLO